jgi:transcriptional regulator with XRE-family HTH domain
MPSSLHSGRYQIFRELLVDARETSGKTQVEVAKLLRKPQSFVSKYERGERRLDFSEFVEIAMALGIDVHSFLDSYQSAAHPAKRR